MDVLATKSLQNEIFSKDFQPPPKRKRLVDYPSITFPNEILEIMPASRSKAKRRGLKILSQGLCSKKIERMKAVRKDIDIALLEKQMRIQEFVD